MMNVTVFAPLDFRSTSAPAPDPWQEGPPELPGAVEGLPLDAWTWLLLICSVAVVLWWMFAKLQEVHQQRKAQQTEQSAFAEQLAVTNVETLVEELRQALADLSETQREEAERLSWLLREEISNHQQCDCHSATDSELLQCANHAQELQPLLAFATAILYARARPTAQLWDRLLDEVCDWLTLSSTEQP